MSKSVHSVRCIQTAFAQLVLVVEITLSVSFGKTNGGEINNSGV